MKLETGLLFGEYLEQALIEAGITTMPFKILTQIIKHPLTDTGLEHFLDDWQTIPEALRPF